jgi:hypothetical protein
MKRVIIVPVTETRQFPGMKILARGGSIAALVGDTFEERTRGAFDSDDSFFYSVASGQADLYTFNTLAEAARFAEGKIQALTAIERSIDINRANATGSIRIAPIAVPNHGRGRKRA